MTEQKLVEKVARAMWEDYMIDPQHNGAEMPTWEMLLAGTDRPIEFPEFVNMHRQAMSQARAALSVIREALIEPTPAMLGAAWNADELHCKDFGIRSLDQFACGYDHWKAMIAASPIGEK